MDYGEKYSNISDDEILHLALDPHVLVLEARTALKLELERRRLSEADVEEYRRHLASSKPGDWPGREKYVANSFNGFGTSIYGKRDFHPDGSFVTTQWVVLFWLPILPLKSMRLLELGPGSSTNFLGFGWSTQYSVYSETRPNATQVTSVYLFILALFLSLATADYLPTQMSFVLFGLVCAVPWLLRRAARKRPQGPVS